jgi:sortase A
VGIAGLGYYFYDNLYRTFYQLYESWEFNRETAPAPVVAETSPSAPVLLPDPDRGTPVENASHSTGVIGRIAIPRLHLSSMVEEGIDSRVLARAVGHIPGTAFPGRIGNVGLAGHRDTFFRALKDLERQDEIEFSTHSGTYRYRVESLMVVEPNNAAVLKPTGGRTLTIVTCFPFHYIGNAPRRFIVHAVAVP